MINNMRLLIIPDVHLKPYLFNMAESVDPSEYDNIICLGDLFDDWRQQDNDLIYQDIMRTVLDFDKKHPDMLWCWGDHDLSYEWGFTGTEFSYWMMSDVSNFLNKMKAQVKNRLKVMHRIDDVLFSHAGLCYKYILMLFTKEQSPDDMIRKINSLTDRADRAAKLWDSDSPIRLPLSDNNNMYIKTEENKNFFQVIGHTPVQQPTVNKNTLMLDTFSTYPDGKPIGDCRLVIFDTETLNWKYCT